MERYGAYFPVLTKHPNSSMKREKILGNISSLTWVM